MSNFIVLMSLFLCFVRAPFKLALLNWMPLDKFWIKKKGMMDCLFSGKLKRCPTVLPGHWQWFKVAALMHDHINFSASVAAVLKSFGPQESAATAKLCYMIDSFFDCLNVRSLTEHKKKRKPFLAPYRSTDDKRYVPK